MDVRFVATAFATAITIIDPIGMIPMTLGATARVVAPPAQSNHRSSGAGCRRDHSVHGPGRARAAGLPRDYAAGVYDRRRDLVVFDRHRHAVRAPDRCKAHGSRRARGRRRRKPGRLSAGGADDCRPRDDRHRLAVGESVARRPDRSCHRRLRLRRGAARNVAVHARLRLLAARDQQHGDSRGEPTAWNYSGRIGGPVRTQRL